MFGAKVYLLVVLLGAEACQQLMGAELVAPLNPGSPLPDRDAKDILPTRNPAPEYYRCLAQLSIISCVKSSSRIKNDFVKIPHTCIYTLFTNSKKKH